MDAIHICLYAGDCREMPKKVFNFPNELIDNAIEISVEDEKLGNRKINLHVKSTKFF